MLRNNSSTPRKSSAMTSSKRTLSASPARRVSPRKLARPDGTLRSPSNTPTKLFAMDNLGAALNHYFSPKKKYSKSPNRGNTKRRINFDTDNELTDDDNDENVAPVSQAPTELRCNLEQLSKCFIEIDNFLPEEILKLETDYEEQFLYWKDILLTKRFNLLLHGLGTKRQLLNKFAENVLSDHYYMNFECFKPGVNCRKIFDAISTEFNIKITHRGLSLTEWATKLRKCLEEKQILFFMVMHNIDARGLRDSMQQRALSLLAASKWIHFIASIDHNNATLLWDQKIRESFNWLFVPVPTFRTYGEELLNYELKSLGLNVKQGGRSHTFASLDVFWQATTQNMRKILQQLAIYASSCGAKDDELLSLPKLCKILKQEFATTSEAVLRQQLGEFIDSSIVRVDKDGNIQLIVDRNLLVAFLESKNI